MEETESRADCVYEDPGLSTRNIEVKRLCGTVQSSKFCLHFAAAFSIHYRMGANILLELRDFSAQQHRL